jgi:hypothetical protein
LPPSPPPLARSAAPAPHAFAGNRRRHFSSIPQHCSSVPQQVSSSSSAASAPARHQHPPQQSTRKHQHSTSKHQHSTSKHQHSTSKARKCPAERASAALPPCISRFRRSQHLTPCPPPRFHPRALLSVPFARTRARPRAPQCSAGSDVAISLGIRSIAIAIATTALSLASPSLSPSLASPSPSPSLAPHHCRAAPAAQAAFHQQQRSRIHSSSSSNPSPARFRVLAPVLFSRCPAAPAPAHVPAAPASPCIASQCIASQRSSPHRITSLTHYLAVHRIASCLTASHRLRQPVSSRVTRAPSSHNTSSRERPRSHARTPKPHPTRLRVLAPKLSFKRPAWLAATIGRNSSSSVIASIITIANRQHHHCHCHRAPPPRASPPASPPALCIATAIGVAVGSSIIGIGIGFTSHSAHCNSAIGNSASALGTQQLGIRYRQSALGKFGNSARGTSHRTRHAATLRWRALSQSQSQSRSSRSRSPSPSPSHRRYHWHRS